MNPDRTSIDLSQSSQSADMQDHTTHTSLIVQVWLNHLLSSSLLDLKSFTLYRRRLNIDGYFSY